MKEIEGITKILETQGFLGLIVGGVLLLAVYLCRGWGEEWIKNQGQEKREKFKLVHERKITILHDVIYKLWELEKAVKKYVTLHGSMMAEHRAGAQNDFVDCLEQFKLSFEPNRIFFNELLAERIDYLRDRLEGTATSFLIEVAGLQKKDGGQSWIEMNQWLQKESPELRREIENEIRKEMS